MCNRRILLVVSIGLLAIFVAMLYFFEPGLSKIFAPCPFHLLTGFYCPGCGTLRALHNLLHGRVAAAFGYNPLAMIMLVPVAAAGAMWAWAAACGHKMPMVFIKPQLIWTLLAVIILYGIFRNVPAWPFMLLAPK